MFSFFQTRKTNKFLITALVFLAITLAGCSLDEDDDGNIYGKWETQFGDIYVIEEINFTYVSDWGFGYSGRIGFSSEFTANSGVLIIEYTVPPTYDGYNNNPFTAVYYRNLTGSTVQLANVINL